MITISFEDRGTHGLCDWIYSSIKKQILGGTLKPNEKLPSKRLLAENLGVSVITVQNAYGLLISEGYIYSIEKKGFFVTELNAVKENDALRYNTEQYSGAPTFTEPNEKHRESADTHGGQNTKNPDWISDFTTNSTSFEKFPFSLWSHTMRQVLNSGDEKLLQRVEVKGAKPLRIALSNYLREFRNMKVHPDQIVIGAGTENLYTMLVQFLGRDKLFAVENPGYHKISAIFELNGAKTVPVKLDGHGMDVQELEKSGAQIAHVSPNHHFPTGIVTQVKRRQEMLQWVQTAPNRLILEDDYDSEFRFNGKPLQTLQSSDTSGKVVYMNTFTKTLAPSFRISFMVLPQKILHRFEEKIKFYSCPVSSFDQYTLARFIDEGFYEKHITRMRNFYRNLRNTLIGSLQSSKLSKICSIHEEDAGLHFLLSIKSPHTAEELKKRFRDQKINIASLNDFFYQDTATDEKTFIVNYSGIKKETISQTVKAMEAAIF